MPQWAARRQFSYRRFDMMFNKKDRQGVIPADPLTHLTDCWVYWARRRALRMTDPRSS
jgi:hypothetical protein